MQTLPHKHLHQQTHKYKHMLTECVCVRETHTQMHSVISMPWHNTVRAAEEYDEYVFGTEQKEMEERRELKEGAEEGGMRKEERKGVRAEKREIFLMTLETDRKTATQLPLQDRPLSLSACVSLFFSLRARDDRSPWSEQSRA